jgi:hypothetical protein
MRRNGFTPDDCGFFRGFDGDLLFVEGEKEKAVKNPTAFFRIFLSIALLLAFVGCSLYYLFSIEYADHVEPLIASVSWLAILGKPVYHSLDSAERYSNLYGPFLYFFTGGFLKLFGPSFFASKIGATLASFASFIFLTISFQTREMKDRLNLLAWLALIYLSFATNFFWIRPEPWLAMFSTLSLFAVIRLKPVAAAFIWAICAVVLVHLKLHGAIYALPALGLFYQRAGFKKTLLALAFAACLMPLPFLLIPNLSFSHLMTWIQITSQHGIETKAIFVNLAWGIFYALPLLMSADLRGFAKRNRIFLVALALTLGLASISGSLRGAGKYHLLPALPYFVWIGSAVFQSGKNRFLFMVGIASIVALTWNAQRTVIGMYLDLSKRHGEAYAQELIEIQDTHPNDSIQMGFGHDYGHTFYRPLLVFRQNQVLLDGATLMDLYLAKAEYTEATLEHLRHCSPSLWVFPKGDQPFDLRHVGNSETLVFRPEISSIFFEHYEKVAETPHYDLWGCRKNHSP